MWNELRYALRMLRRSSLLTAAAVLSLALGIGANTAIFSLLDQVLLRSLPVRDPGRLAVLHTEYRAPGWSTSDTRLAVFSHPMYRDIRDRNSVFSGVLARSGAPVNVSAGGETQRAAAELVSGNFFEVLGVTPALGRLLAPEDDRPGAHPVVALSYAYWTRRFGGSPEVMNQKVLVNGQPMQVIGAVARGFRGLVSGQTPDVFVPMARKREITPTWDALEDRRVRWVNIVARLNARVPLPQAQAATRTLYRSILEQELAAIGRLRNRRAEEEFLNHNLELLGAGQGINQLRFEWESPLLALMAMVGLVLLIACANIANLLLARAAGREKEMAIRVAIGAGRFAIVRQLLVESFVLALAGGLLGLLVAGWTSDALLRMLPEGAGGGWLAAQVDLRVLAFNLALACLTGLAFGLAPALSAARPAVAGALKSQVTAGWRRGEARFRRGLVAGQVALSLLLLIGAGLFARSLANLENVDPGFRSERLLTFTVDPQLSGYDRERGHAFFRELRERLAALPGVRAAGAANPGPLTHSHRGGNITVEGYQIKGDQEAGASMHAVTPQYFRTLGIPLLMGREFTGADGAKAPKVVVVNEAFVKRYVSGGSPLGKRLAFGAGNRIVLDREIVGVVRDNRHSLREPAGPTIFFPYTQDERLDRLYFYVRAVRREAGLAREVRGVVRELDANVPVMDLRPVRLLVDESVYAERLIAMLSTAFGILALLLAAVGLYGVVAYTVERRTAEFGIRIAVGGMPRDVLRLVLKDVLLLIGAGMALGLPAALAAGRLVESQLYGLKAADPLVFGGAILVLAGVALLSGYLPGRRAARIDPLVALRYE